MARRTSIRSQNQERNADCPRGLRDWAEERGYLVKGESPFPAMVRYKETKSAVSIFTPEHIASLLTEADKTLRPFLALGAFAGLRTAELQRLDWNEIDLDRGFITVDASKAKTRQRRLVPISENLRLWLMPCQQASGPVCLHQRPQIAAARLCKAVAWQENGLRHSFISYRLPFCMTRRGWPWKLVTRPRSSSAIIGNWSHPTRPKLGSR